MSFLLKGKCNVVKLMNSVGTGKNLQQTGGVKATCVQSTAQSGPRLKRKGLQTTAVSMKSTCVPSKLQGHFTNTDLLTLITISRLGACGLGYAQAGELFSVFATLLPVNKWGEWLVTVHLWG